MSLACMHVCIPHVCLVPVEVKRTSDSLGHQIPCGCWESNQCPQEEQQVLFLKLIFLSSQPSPSLPFPSPITLSPFLFRKGEASQGSTLHSKLQENKGHPLLQRLAEASQQEKRMPKAGSRVRGSPRPCCWDFHMKIKL